MKLLVTGGAGYISMRRQEQRSSNRVAGVFLSLDFVTISIASKHWQAWPNKGR
jgi:hypothetical protein